MSELQEKELFQQLLQRDYNDLHVQKLSLQARLEITKNKLASAESEIAALREALAARAPVVNQVLPSRDDFPSTNNPQTTKQVTGAEEERHLNEAAYGQEPPRDVRMEGPSHNNDHNTAETSPTLDGFHGPARVSRAPERILRKSRNTQQQFLRSQDPSSPAYVSDEKYNGMAEMRLRSYTHATRICETEYGKEAEQPCGRCRADARPCYIYNTLGEEQYVTDKRYSFSKYLEDDSTWSHVTDQNKCASCFIGNGNASYGNCTATSSHVQDTISEGENITVSIPRRRLSKRPFAYREKEDGSHDE